MQQDWHWDLALIPPSDRVEQWFEILSTTYLAFGIAMVPGRPQDFDAKVRKHAMGAMSLIRTSALPHRGRRTRHHVVTSTRDVIGLNFVESGRLGLDLNGERVVLGPGDVMIWDGNATGYFEVLEPVVKTTLIVPRSLAATALPSYRESYIQLLPPGHQPTRSLSQVLFTLNEQLPAMATGARQASAQLVTELLKPLDRLRGGDVAKPDRWPAYQLRERALGYIDTNLHDAKLSPVTIAAAHQVSVRTLYAAVDGLGMTLGAYIRHRRLARSYDDLLFGSDPVAVIASRCGFGSPAHFSRLFRDRYGLTPTTVRRQRA
ncbi:helix-turn-helix domain-containing protein [Actinoplanes sp. TBRC 11911]|uniref:helix-turn-helix domain-containing protein n=1 Tax=Actinoplanes sp. TBRC 11911 TaxID=2729386 RepID=UPI00145FCF3B|nr:helix-turn-helix domain-containing protein [Actinoplanes sp. TBRC 11911]NMO50676.1 helix-turn-helix domain-containing protein [Actinoplanes sp. TBRC 11911]